MVMYATLTNIEVLFYLPRFATEKETRQIIESYWFISFSSKVSYLLLFVSFFSLYFTRYDDYQHYCCLHHN